MCCWHSLTYFQTFLECIEPLIFDYFFDSSYNVVFQFDFNPMRMRWWIRQYSGNDAFRQLAWALVLFLHHTYFLSNFDVITFISVHNGLSSTLIFVGLIISKKAKIKKLYIFIPIKFVRSSIARALLGWLFLSGCPVWYKRFYTQVGLFR